jgi:LPPG:FO 2-phospho-L-lactate transferase
MKVVALAGGTGAAKFLRGLAKALDPASLTIVGNTGDDLEVWGLSISPDLDTVMYTLAGLIDESKGWGLASETFHCREAMAALGRPTFFALGDKDLATHVRRTEALRAGHPLSRVTDDLRRSLGVRSRILPMSDDRVRTRVRTPDGWLDFQEFFVRDRCEPDVVDVAYEGADRARAAPGVIETLLEADLVLICPSNPVSSVGPILAVSGVRSALVETRGRVVAVSPIIGDAPVSGPAGKMMRAKGLEVSPLGVARAYEGWLDALVVDGRDASLTSALGARDVRAIVTDIVMGSADREVALARAVLEAVS